MSDIIGFQNTGSADQRRPTGTANTLSRAVQSGTRLYDDAGDRVSDVWSSTRQFAASQPFLIVAGAAAVGAGLGWLLPAGRRETEVMAEVAHKVTDVAREAADTAVEAGRHQVDELAHNALASVGGAVVQAVMASGSSDRRES